MLDKCKECYEDNKTPDNSNCLKCDENYKRLEQENKTLKNSLKDFQYSDEQHLLKVIELEQENKELKEWKDKVVKLFESACRCKYLNEETDICSYTNEKCININKCVYKYQELNSNYRSALEEISGLTSPHCTQCSQIMKIINEVLQ